MLLLGRRLSLQQYGAIVMLMGGVALVQLRIGDTVQPQEGQDPWLGFLAVMVACVTSGFAGVYMELMLKDAR